MTQRGSDGMLTEARNLLTTWGNWASGSVARDIGYPREAPFMHADEGGRAFTDGENDEAERVEEVMCLIKRCRPDAYYALYCEYVLKLTNIEAANRLKCSVTKYKWRRGDGEHFIAGAFISVQVGRIQKKCLTG